MSRPVERIDNILDELRKVWKQYPDMRLGQLIENSSSRINSNVWNLEDTELMAILELRLNSVVDRIDPVVLRGDPFGPWSERVDGYKMVEDKLSVESSPQL